jgi:excisionase family DNA binding protein
MLVTERRYVNDRPIVSPCLSAQQSLKLLSPDEVSGLLGVERVTVIRLARAGKIPSIKVGKAVRFRPSTIERWLIENEG